MRTLGGFLPLRIPLESAAKNSLLSLLTSNRPYWALHNARSALNALLRLTSPHRVWLPAYICNEVAAAIPPQIPTLFYPLDGKLNPSVEFLDAHIMPGDHVLAIDYFGRPVTAEFSSLAARWPDVGWIEDRAHALDPGSARWADWVLLSPRKLVGVPDGGILVEGRKPLPALNPVSLGDFSFALPAIERFEDPDDACNDRWYPRYVDSEQSMSIGIEAISRMSLTLLDAIPAESDCVIRRSNYQCLHERLARWSLFPESAISFVPMGFPIQVPSAVELAEKLRQHRIFAARHWAHLPSDPREFPTEHQLAQQLITLPCDYRYQGAQMQHMADVVTKHLQGM
jgi:hypothetical protein